MVKEDIENRSQNASFHQTYESAQIICDRILWTASQVIADSSASLVRLTRPRESSPFLITEDIYSLPGIYIFLNHKLFIKSQQGFDSKIRVQL